MEKEREREGGDLHMERKVVLIVSRLSQNNYEEILARNSVVIHNIYSVYGDRDKPFQARGRETISRASLFVSVSFARDERTRS